MLARVAAEDYTDRHHIALELQAVLMKKFCAFPHKTAGSLATAAISALWLGLFSLPVKAQLPSQPADTTNPEKIRQQDQSAREMQLRNLSTQASLAIDPRRVEALAAEVEQDFQRILILNNELARFLLNNRPLNFEFVSDATAEIKKRASHLQKTLALNKPDDDPNQAKRNDFPDERVRDGVAVLCSHIKNFVTNPVIDKPGTVNAPQLLRARRDLQNIIEVSSNLRKTADRLKKSSP